MQEYTEEMTKNNIDFVMCPNSFESVPQTIDELLNPEQSGVKTPVSEYKMDYFTVVANCLGVPALTVPIYESHDVKTGQKFNGFPTSIRLQGFFGEDYHLLRIGQHVEGILQKNEMTM